jgi:hypothetical protein
MRAFISMNNVSPQRWPLRRLNPGEGRRFYCRYGRKMRRECVVSHATCDAQPGDPNPKTRGALPITRGDYSSGPRIALENYGTQHYL